MARRQHLSLMLLAGIFACITIFYVFSPSQSIAGTPVARPAPAVEAIPQRDEQARVGGDDAKAKIVADQAASEFVVPDGILMGGSIAPKLENATAKAELGRATWKLLHTMMARFPEKPTEDDQLALRTYMQLFARLYPCGDCASHFQKVLAEYPPQVSSRNAAAGWACFVHNIVNERLHKEIFDCSKIGDFYDCGCGEEGEKKDGEGQEEGKGGEETEKE